MTKAPSNDLDLWAPGDVLDDDEKCDTCGGTGHLLQAICPTCEGKGVVVDTFWDESLVAESSKPNINYHQPWLYPKQKENIFASARYAVIEASTKTGKTVGCMVWLLEKAFECRGIYWWISPVYAQARMVYRRMKRAVPAYMYKANESELTLTFRNDSIIFFKSAEKPDNLYGESVRAAVIDEATRVREESWHAVRSTLTSTEGPVRLIGNVKGRKNWAYKLARKAEAEAKAGASTNYHYGKLTAWDAVAAGILARAEVEDAQAALPESVFRELYLAEASEDGSNPFDLQAIRDCIAPLAEGPEVAWGWDLARGRRPGSDWTVGIGLNKLRYVSGFWRFQAPWDQQIQRIRFATKRVRALIDATGVGDPIVEELQKSGRYEGFVFSPRSKQHLMEGLALEIQQREVHFPAGPISDELETFEYEYTRTGVIYKAAEGLHDDCVMALALAVQQASSRPLRTVKARLVGDGVPTRRRQAEQTSQPAPEDVPTPRKVEPAVKKPNKSYWKG